MPEFKRYSTWGRLVGEDDVRGFTFAQLGKYFFLPAPLPISAKVIVLAAIPLITAITIFDNGIQL